MAVIPAGSPLWLRTADISQYGGDLNKRNWGGLGAVDPLTDITAAQMSRLATDVAGLARVAPLATITVVDSNTLAHAVAQTGGLTVVSARCAWGVAGASYSGDSPPTGMPSVTLGATTYGWGYIVDIGATRSDDYGVSGAVTPKMFIVTLNDSSWTGAWTQQSITGASLTFTRYDGSYNWIGGGTVMTIVVW